MEAHVMKYVFMQLVSVEMAVGDKHTCHGLYEICFGKNNVHVAIICLGVYMGRSQKRVYMARCGMDFPSLCRICLEARISFFMARVVDGWALKKIFFILMVHMTCMVAKSRAYDILSPLRLEDGMVTCHKVSSHEVMEIFVFWVSHVQMEWEKGQSTKRCWVVSHEKEHR